MGHRVLPGCENAARCDPPRIAPSWREAVVSKGVPRRSPREEKGSCFCFLRDSVREVSLDWGSAGGDSGFFFSFYMRFRSSSSSAALGRLCPWEGRRGFGLPLGLPQRGPAERGRPRPGLRARYGVSFLGRRPSSAGASRARSSLSWTFSDSLLTFHGARFRGS